MWIAVAVILIALSVLLFVANRRISNDSLSRAANVLGIAGGIAGVIALVGLQSSTGPTTPSSPERRQVSEGADSPPSGHSDDIPFSVAITKREGTCDGDWVIPGSSKPTTWPTETGIWSDDAQAARGAGASPGEVQIFVQGRSQAEVVLTDLSLQVHERRPPISGTLLDEACGDMGAFRWLQANLDTNPPSIESRYEQEAVPEDASQYELTPIKFPYTVSLSDTEVFLISAVTAQCDCTWTAELSWASAGRTGTYVIDDEGKPFRTTSISNVIQKCSPESFEPLALQCIDPQQ